MSEIMKQNNMKNIYIEGIQGMGKSTLIKEIAAQIPALHMCMEGDYSPVDLAWCTWMTQEEYETILKRYGVIRDEIMKNTVSEQGHFVISYTRILTDIPNFHKELEKYEVHNGRKTLQELKELVLTRYRSFSETGYLFECSFFQNIMEDLILYHMLDDDEIVDFYHELYDAVNKDEFLLLYLYSDRLEETIEAIKKERCDDRGKELWYPMMLEYLTHSPYGERHGYGSFEDMIAHFRHRQKLEMRIIREVVGGRAVVLPSREWKMEDIIPLVRVNGKWEG